MASQIEPSFLRCHSYLCVQEILEMHPDIIGIVLKLMGPLFQRITAAKLRRRTPQITLKIYGHELELS